MLSLVAAVGILTNRYSLRPGDESQRAYGALMRSSVWDFLSIDGLLRNNWSGVHRAMGRLVADTVHGHSVATQIAAIQLASVAALMGGAVMLGVAVSLITNRLVGCAIIALILGVDVGWDVALGAMPGVWNFLFSSTAILLWVIGMKRRSVTLFILSGILLTIATSMRHEVVLIAGLLWLLEFRVVSWWAWLLIGATSTAYATSKLGIAIFDYLSTHGGYLKLWTNPNYDFGSGWENAATDLGYVWKMMRHSFIWLAAVVLIAAFGAVCLKSRQLQLPVERRARSRRLVLGLGFVPLALFVALLCLTVLGWLYSYERYWLFVSLLLIGTVGIVGWSALLRLGISEQLRQNLLATLVAVVVVLTGINILPELEGRRGLSNDSRRVHKFLEDHNAPSNKVALDRITSSNQYMLYGWDQSIPHEGWCYSARPIARKTKPAKQPIASRAQPPTLDLHQFRDVENPAEAIASDLHRYLGLGYGKFVVVPSWSVYSKKRDSKKLMGRHMMHSYLWPYISAVPGVPGAWLLESPWPEYRWTPVVLLEEFATKKRQILRNISYHQTEDLSEGTWKAIRSKGCLATATPIASPVSNTILLAAPGCGKFTSSIPCDVMAGKVLEIVVELRSLQNHTPVVVTIETAETSSNESWSLDVVVGPKVKRLVTSHKFKTRSKGLRISIAVADAPCALVVGPIETLSNRFPHE